MKATFKPGMMRRHAMIGLALLGYVVMIDSRAARPAPSSATLDVLPDDLFAAPARPPQGTAPFAPRPAPAPSGNPLWSIPLSGLSATRERPLFSASRRPPPRAVVAPPLPPPVMAMPEKEPDPAPPPLALIGSIVGDADAIAIFFDTSSQQVLRLRRGDSHAGWALVSVLQREVTLQRDAQTETLTLRRNDATGAPAMPLPQVPNVGLSYSGAVPGVGPASGGGLVPGLGPAAGASYAPFIPRSTPKNGESDGL